MSKHKINIFANQFWDQKPLWCQPWSVIFTGILITILGFVLIKIIILNLILSIFVVLWWFLFLYVAPLTYINQLNDYEHQEKTNN